METAPLSRVQLTNGRGAQLTGVLASPLGSTRACAVMPPAFGHRIRTARCSPPSSTASALPPLRFDLSNHPGLSEGVLTALTLTSMAGDVLAAVDAAGDLGWGLDEIVVIAPGMTGRAAIRALSLPVPAAGLVLLAPVADIRASVAGLAGIDHWGAGSPAR